MRSRRGTEVRQRQKQIGVRILPAEHERLRRLTKQIGYDGMSHGALLRLALEALDERLNGTDRCDRAGCRMLAHRRKHRGDIVLCAACEAEVMAELREEAEATA